MDDNRVAFRRGALLGAAAVAALAWIPRLAEPATGAGFTFETGHPVTITLKYADPATTINETILQLFYWDTTNQQWTTNGIDIVERNPTENKLVIAISHLTDFALFGPTESVFLPLVVKNN